MRVSGIALVGLAISGWVLPAVAQTVVVGGGNLRPPVEVNLGAIDEANRRDGFGASASGSAGPGTVKLRPPKSTKSTPARKATAAKAAPTPARSAPIPSLVPTAPPMTTPAPPAPAPLTTPPTPAPAPVASAPQRSLPDVQTPAPPPVVAQPAPVAEPPRVASLPPTSGTGDVTLGFTAGDAQLSSDNTRLLDQLAARLASGEDRVQIKAYASAAGADAASSARRLSLSRALAVRSYLMDKGVRSTRIDVRAMGPSNDSGPPDRVDVASQPR